MNKMIFVFIMTGLAVWVSVPFASPAQEYELVAEWGRQGSGDGEFADIRGLAVDAYGNVYTTDTENCCIQKFTSSGVFVKKWEVLDGKWRVPFYGVAVGPSGNVYATGGWRIWKFTSQGTLLRRWDMHEDRHNPWAIAVDMAGNVYVCSILPFGEPRVEKFSSVQRAFLSRAGSRIEKSKILCSSLRAWPWIPRRTFMCRILYATACRGIALMVCSSRCGGQKAGAPAVWL